MKRETNQMHINRVLLNIFRENMDHREIFVLAVEVRWKIHQRIWDLSFKDDEQKKKTRFSISSISQQYLVEMPSQFRGFPHFRLEEKVRNSWSSRHDTTQIHHSVSRGGCTKLVGIQSWRESKSNRWKSFMASSHYPKSCRSSPHFSELEGRRGRPC